MEIINGIMDKRDKGKLLHGPLPRSHAKLSPQCTFMQILAIANSFNLSTLCLLLSVGNCVIPWTAMSLMSLIHNNHAIRLLVLIPSSVYFATPYYDLTFT